MKTLELDLKKKVLIVDLPIDAKNIYMSGDSVIFNTNKSCFIKSLNGNYESLCKGSDLTEEIASDLCHNIGNSLTIIGDAYLDDENDEYYFDFAQNAIISAIESKGFYWLQNPYKQEAKKWQEAEEKTFRNPLIFVNK